MADAETLLLIDDHKAEFWQLYVGREYSMSADQYIHFTFAG